MHFRPGFLLLALCFAMQIFLLAYVWQKDVVHTGITVSMLALPFVLLLILGAMMAMRAHQDQRDYILLSVSALFGCLLPWFFVTSGQLLNYGEWIRAGMLEKTDASLSFIGFLSLQLALILAIRFFLKCREGSDAAP